MTAKTGAQSKSNPKRHYTQRTLKVLFALSGNQCAEPSCTNTLIELANVKPPSYVPLSNRVSGTGGRMFRA